MPLQATAAEPSFLDVPEDHFAFDAIEYLKGKHIIEGYKDGTFRPNQGVNRAEALKFIISPLFSKSDLEKFKTTSFSDVSADSWYLPYVEAAKSINIIDGPPAKLAFNPTNAVLKIELLKMVELAQETDPLHSFSEIRLPLSVDIQDSDSWYYPYVRYALTSSLLTAGSGGLLLPDKPLTRGETAVILYRMLRFKENRRTEALLQMNEQDVLATLARIEAADISQATYASARALLYARGAHTSSPNDPLVVATLKMTEGLRALVRSYQALNEGNKEEVIRLAKDAWQLAEIGKKRSTAVITLTERVQDMATAIADTARMMENNSPQE